MKVLSKIGWEKKDCVGIILVPRKDERVIAVWDSKGIRKDISLKGFESLVRKNPEILIQITQEVDENKFQLGPTVKALKLMENLCTVEEAMEELEGMIDELPEKAQKVIRKAVEYGRREEKEAV